MGKTLSLRINIDNETGKVFANAASGTLLAAIGSDNIISEPLTVPGKVSSGVKFTQGSWGEKTTELSISSLYQNYYITYGTGYEYDELTGYYTLTGINTCLYKDCYSTLIDKYLVSTSRDYFFNSTNTVGTTSTMRTLKIKEASLNTITIIDDLISISEKYKDYYIQYATGYEYDEDSGKYDLTGIGICKYSECYNDLANKYLIWYISPGGSPTAFSVENVIDEMYINDRTTIYRIDSVPDFHHLKYSEISKSTSINVSESVLATTEDDYGTSYYYRGNIENNYISYSGMCWRIVRVDGNGNIKIVLADENGVCDANTDSEENATSAFIDNNTQYAYNTSSGYNVKYDAGNLPSVLNSWLSSKITDTSLIETVDWCHDTTVKTRIDDWYDGYSQYAWTNTYYGAYNRLFPSSSASPSLKCDFTGLNNTTTTKINTNIGLLTADEVAFAGGSGSTLSENANNTYWTLSPAGTIGEYGIANIFAVAKSGGLINLEIADAYNNDEPYKYSVRPAIVLRSDVLATTNSDTSTYGQPGTQTNPYVIS